MANLGFSLKDQVKIELKFSPGGNVAGFQDLNHSHPGRTLEVKRMWSKVVGDSQRQAPYSSTLRK